MKQINLISVLNGHKTIADELFNSYLDFFSVKIKKEELNDLRVFVKHLISKTNNIKLFDKYFIGYSIPQIGKEFDLLRIDDDSILNVELKRKSTPEKIKKQILRNRYYLSFLNKDVYIFTYVAEERKLYSVDKEDNIIEVKIKYLLSILEAQKVIEIKDIDCYFNPSNYLVSPFNSTEAFINGKYFLTKHQEEFKCQILKQLNLSNYSILAIKGKAGTGKTLLTYDIVKEFSEHHSILLVHCGYLNDGHISLRDNYGWEIVSAKKLQYRDFSNYHLVVIDEAQRVYPIQLEHVVNETKKLSINCLFSYDGQQTLRRGEINNNIEQLIQRNVTVNSYELTTKIRTNKEVASFIQCLFNKNRQLEKVNYSNIKLNYFSSYKLAVSFLKQLKSENWKIINYTPSTVYTLPYESHKLDDENDNAHTVIGQEFDNVVAVVDEYFYYNNNRLSTKKYRNRPYYHPTKMLFQIVSRTRIGLNVVIINNKEILSRCLDILNN
ncbi:hypothetical protein DF185_00905 [Marinifilum breve]|uniref:Schlafen group 3-like DNA/RNA helicase domain-containing protein n=1 Tax=Marinifilum breve TaxID=2184082 RepID=A0A2V4AF11_9BACT|nr:DNA/RNA helicase domain-containing protein [Marinifilum breve]PXY02684.1 hypothetical protein DF185_00905 [Marinifilum breve]